MKDLLSETKQTMKTAVVYVRVSTEEQTVQNQIEFLNQWGKAHNYKITHIFEDASISGKIKYSERQGFSDLLKFLQTNLVDAVLTYEISRIGRTFYDTLEAIKTIDNYAPLIACSPKEYFLQNMDSSIRRLIISILSWVAEREREVLVERTKLGMERARAEGKHIGRPTIVFNDDEIKKMLQSGMSIQAVAKKLKISKVSLYKHLCQKVGHTPQQRPSIKDQFLSKSLLKTD